MSRVRTWRGVQFPALQFDRHRTATPSTSGALHVAELRYSVGVACASPQSLLNYDAVLLGVENVRTPCRRGGSD